MNKPIREPCKDCKNNRYCGLERRGICTDFKPKDVQDGQTEAHTLKRGDAVGKRVKNRKQNKNQWRNLSAGGTGSRRVPKAGR